jgi:SAM-dependent methyltransferase
MTNAQPARSDLPLPPLDLLQRTGNVSVDDPAQAYEDIGATIRSLIQSILPEDWSWAGNRVLDFGCGAGRVLRHFAPESDKAEFWGCDIDHLSIGWLSEHLSPPFNVFTVDEAPGLPQEDGFFDLIYAISVYTHITDDWAGWLLEHHRVLADDGLLLVSFLGEGMIGELIGEQWAEDKVGMNSLLHGNPWDNGGPIVLHSPWWLRAHWGRAFEILDLRPYTGPPSAGHGLVLMRKRPGTFTVEELQALEPDEPREIVALQHHIKQLRTETGYLRAALSLASDRESLIDENAEGEFDPKHLGSDSAA